LCKAIKKAKKFKKKPKIQSGEQWSEEALDFFEDITYSSKWKKLKLQLIKEKSVESKTIVSLYDKNKVNICNMM